MRAELRRRRTRRSVNRILSREGAAVTTRAEQDFDELQNFYPVKPEYGYDPASCWIRASNRVERLLRFPEFVRPGKQILDVGCGDGTLAVVLSSYGHHCMLTDAEDWREARAKSVSFVKSKAELLSTAIEGQQFDLVCSFNTFEHLPDPVSALREMVAVCRPGGLIFIEFAPLFCSAWGLHAHRTLRMPFPQYLFGTEFLRTKLAELGIRDLGRIRETLQYTNGWKPAQYRQLWETSGCATEMFNVEQTCEGFELIVKYPECFRGLRLSLEDVETQSIAVALRKPLGQVVQTITTGVVPASAAR